MISAAAVLRIEATYYSVRNLKVFRALERDPDGEKDWRCLRKGGADLSRRADLSQKATERYAEALATVEDKTPLKAIAAEVCKPVQWKGRRVRALHPLDADDARLLEAINRGEFMLDGFRNRDLRALLYADKSDSPKEERSRSAAITRKLRMLRAHHLIQKVRKSHRYQMSEFGRATVAAFLAAREANTAKLTQAA